MTSHTVSGHDTRTQLRQILPQLKALSTAPEMARDAYAKGIVLTVDGARNIATALDRTANKLADGSEGQVEMSRLSRDIRGAITEQYPEYAPVNALYASRKRAINALGNSRATFLTDTDKTAAQTARNSAERGQPGPAGETIPSERELAMAGAREATTEAAGKNARGSAGTTSIDLSGANQSERNRMVFGEDAASRLEDQASTRANNLDTLGNIASGSSSDTTETGFAAGVRAAAKWAVGMKHSAAMDLARNVRGLSADDAGRIVRLYTTPGQADNLLSDLQKRYGQRKAQFIVSRLGAIAATAAAGKVMQ